MDRNFDYAQKILLAVEIGSEPRRLADMPSTYSMFQRLSIPEVVRAFDESESLFVRLIAGRKFKSVLDKHMGYWEMRIPAGKQCFVHYAIGGDAVISGAFNRLKTTADRWTLLGIYHVEPQSSAYPFGFPLGPAPSHWSPGETRAATKDSIFWFNFFPAQPRLFEKTFAVWVLFNTFQLAEGGECNQLVAWEGKDRLLAQGVDDFVQVNLNRFTSLPGFFNSAHEAGKHTFTVDPNYLWYGMLLRQL
jgi:hypothetical protein